MNTLASRTRVVRIRRLLSEQCLPRQMRREVADDAVMSRRPRETIRTLAIRGGRPKSLARTNRPFRPSVNDILPLRWKREPGFRSLAAPVVSVAGSPH